jgi:ParB-like nuclease domain
MTSSVFSLPPHPIAALFPLMTGSELDALAADIKANGLKSPIILDQEGAMIVDGRNRREACKRAGVTPRTQRLHQGEDPVRFIVSLNVRRRHLDESQRGMVAARIANLGQGARTDLASIEAKSDGRLSQVDAAKLLNIGRATVQRAKTVVEIGAPELIEAVDGGTIKLNEAERIAKLSPERQRAIVALPKRERKAASPASAPARVQAIAAPAAFPESVVRVDLATALMGEVRKLGHIELIRFADQFRAYFGQSTAATPPCRSGMSEPIATELICRSPRGSCRYGSCAARGECQVVAAAWTMKAV